MQICLPSCVRKFLPIMRKLNFSLHTLRRRVSMAQRQHQQGHPNTRTPGHQADISFGGKFNETHNRIRPSVYIKLYYFLYPEDAGMVESHFLVLSTGRPRCLLYCIFWKLAPGHALVCCCGSYCCGCILAGFLSACQANEFTSVGHQKQKKTNAVAVAGNGKKSGNERKTNFVHILLSYRPSLFFPSHPVLNPLLPCCV